MMESEVMGNYHASFGERDRETRMVQAMKVRPVPTPFSPVLANMTLDGLYKKLRDKYPQKQNGGLVNLVRYADDFIVTGRTRELLEGEVKPLIEEHLKERGLELSPEKTKITHINEGFDFLGQNVRKYNGKMLIMPSKKNINSFLAKVRGIINSNATAKAGNLIGLLNPIIRGWANYHRHVVSKETFNSIDSTIYERLWQWSKRRHPNKTHYWIRKKYFASSGNDHWVFSGTVEGKDGTPRTIQLLNAASVPIKRHTKIKGEANPYAPEWETYFERRLDVQMEANLKGYKKLLRLWLEQQGLCPVCNQ